MSSIASSISVAATNKPEGGKVAPTSTAKSKKARANKNKNAAAAAAAIKTAEPVQVNHPPNHNHDKTSTVTSTSIDSSTVVSNDLQTRLQISNSESSNRNCEKDASQTTTHANVTTSVEESYCSSVSNGHSSDAPSESVLATSDTADKTPESSTAEPPAAGASLTHESIQYVVYENELQMPDIMRLIQKDLSEPYSIYTYRYFIHNWPKLCFLAMHEARCVGAIVCKLDIHRQTIKRGYIAMLAVDKTYRKLKIGTNLVQNAIRAMLEYGADEVVLETEITNTPALRLYENLGFVRDKRLFGYYLNGVDALRLKLWFR